MNFTECNSCKFSLPKHRLSPIVVRLKNGQRKRLLLCSNCKAKLNRQFKGQ